MGDMGGGDSNSISLLLPLSTLGKGLSLEDSGEALKSSEEDVVEGMPFFCISLSFWAMRSETLAVR
jgi:hypothetical protein